MEILDRISGLDKLIELLTEHCRRYYGFKETDDIKIDNDSCNFYLYHKGKRYFSIQPEKVIFKDFGFIKRLVDNDKIGRNKNSDRSAMIDLMRAEVKEGTNVFEGTEKYEWYIMILSIQDNPIEFLVSILK